MWETFIPTPCWCGKYGCAPVNGKFFNKKKPMETDEISVLIETGNQFSIHQTRLSEASPLLSMLFNGLSFPTPPPKKKNTSFIQSKLQNPPQKCYYLLPLPPNKHKKCNKIHSHPTKFRFFFSAPSHGGALIFLGVGMA